MHCDNMLHIYIYIQHTLNPLSLGKSKNYRLSESFFHKFKITVKPTIQQNLSVSKSLFGKF